MSAHRILHDMLMAPFRVSDPGDAGSIAIDRFGLVCPVTTAGASETRTLQQPTKAGLLAGVVHDVDGGDFTLTVTGGYNGAADTDIAFADAGDFAMFVSVKVGASYYWRIVSQQGTDAKVSDLTLNELEVVCSTDAVANIQPVQITTTVTGAGATGGRMISQLNVNAAMGGWANAIKGYTKLATAGKVTGLGSAICAELEMSAGATDGTYAPMEVELVMPENSVTGTAIHFIHCAVSGNATAVGLFDHNGAAIRLDGISIDTDHIVQTSVKDGVKSTHSLRISINGTFYYIPLSTGQDFNA